VQDGEEIIDEDSEMSDHKENCITLDDIIGYDAPTTDMD
jgi:hypothetical protein